jgi:DNA-binding transcriptional regulator YdaS (Cro superfamily)
VSELPLLAILRAPEPVREDVLRSFGDEEEPSTKFAVRWAWDHRRGKSMSQMEAARLMGIASPHLCNILSGRKYLPPHKINAYEQIVGNRAVSMTIERFRQIRERELVAGLARAVAENMVRVA